MSTIEANEAREESHRLIATLTAERDTYKAMSDSLREQVAELKARNAMLVQLLKEAASDIEDWGQYAGDYFKDKHDLDGCVKRYLDAAAKEASK